MCIIVALSDANMSKNKNTIELKMNITLPIKNMINSIALKSKKCKAIDSSKNAELQIADDNSRPKLHFNKLHLLTIISNSLSYFMQATTCR